MKKIIDSAILCFSYSLISFASGRHFKKYLYYSDFMILYLSWMYKSLIHETGNKNPNSVPCPWRRWLMWLQAMGLISTPSTLPSSHWSNHSGLLKMCKYARSSLAERPFPCSSPGRKGSFLGYLHHWAPSIHLSFCFNVI